MFTRAVTHTARSLRSRAVCTRSLPPVPTTIATRLQQRWTSKKAGDIKEHEGTFSQFDKVPKLPLPSLYDTMERFDRGIAGLLAPGDLADARMLSLEFANDPKVTALQRSLWEYDRSLPDSSYIAEIWEDAYLCDRGPHVINVSPSFLYVDDPRFTSLPDAMAARAAAMTHSFLTDMLRIESETYPPGFERGRPLDMTQFKYAFGTTRIPQKERDALVTATQPSHIAVMCQGRVYKLNVIEEGGPGGERTVVSLDSLRVTLQAIADSARRAGPTTVPAGVLTAWTRDQWAEAREALQSTSSTSRETLQCVESAAFVVALDVDKDMSTQSRHALGELYLHADGVNRWFDKSLTFIFTADGRAGCNFEHSWGDGHTLAMLSNESCGRIANDQRYTPQSQPPSVAPLPFHEQVWDLGSHATQMQTYLSQATVSLQERTDDLDLYILDFEGFGKGLLKNLKYSPDSFVQLAFQLTYARLHDFAVRGTYESCNTKNFKAGRTEAIRCVTAESSQFVRAMLNDYNILAQLRCMEGALQAHKRVVADCQKGFGVDRHLYALEVFSQRQNAAHGTPIHDFFSDIAYRGLIRSVMSTSSLAGPYFDIFGFGPVVPEGYGIAYHLQEDGFIFHITSFKSDGRTSAERFAHELERAFIDMVYLTSVLYGEQAGMAPQLLVNNVELPVSQTPADGFDGELPAGERQESRRLALLSSEESDDETGR